MSISFVCSCLWLFLFVGVLCLVCPLLPVSQDYPFSNFLSNGCQLLLKVCLVLLLIDCFSQVNRIPSIVLTRISLKTMHIWAKVALWWVFGHGGGAGMGTWAERWHVDGLKYILHKSYMSRFVLHDFVLKCIKSSTLHVAAHITMAIVLMMNNGFCNKRCICILYHISLGHQRCYYHGPSRIN